MRFSILLTNDDGIQSPGFDALESAFSSLGEITIVAPDREMSACSQSLTLNQPLNFTHLSPNRYAVQGTPADCVILAAIKILEKKPDLVISGVNRGWNVGDDVAYSGTIAGAFEAALQGLPAIAVSTSLPEPNFVEAAKVAAQIATEVLRDGLPRDVILNVNYPERWNGEIRVTRQGRRASKTVLVENMDPRGREYFWLHEELHKTSENGGSGNVLTDYAAIRAGYVSVTPLQLDRTAHPYIDRMSSWLRK